MQLRILLLAGTSGALGWFAHGIASGTAEAQPATVVRTVEVVKPVVISAPAREPELAVADDDLVVEIDYDEADGEDLGELLARAQRATAPEAPDHNAIHGRVTDPRTGEPLVGVAIVATSPQMATAQTVISNENGAYRLTDLAAGYYTVTFYYSDITVERTNVMVSSLDATQLTQTIDLTARPSYADIPVITTYDEPGITIDTNYVKNIPVPGRTFESVLGVAAGSQEDSVGISFSGTVSLENKYVVDGIDTTDLRFGE